MQQQVTDMAAEATKKWSLNDEIDEFRKNRKKLDEVMKSTQALLKNDFANILADDFHQSLCESLSLSETEKLLANLHKGDSDSGETVSRPSIVVVGQTKSGKSSFINELLGSTIVAQAASPCTARVTRLTFSDNMQVKVMSKSGQQIGETIQLDKPRVDENLLKLQDESREDEQMISSIVEVGLPIEFLRKGIDIIDSPGLNENRSLDSLTMQAIQSLLPIIVYVIDSNSGVTLAVKDDLLKIKASSADILFIVTKMDVSDSTAEESGRSKEEIEEEKADRVFKRLQELSFLGREETRSRCRNFLCVSCWEMRRYRRKHELAMKKKQKQKNDDEQQQQPQNERDEKPKWVTKFEEVEQRIVQFASEQFKNLISLAGGSLRDRHRKILTMFLDRANNIMEYSLRKQKALVGIKTLEGKIHDQSKAIIENHRRQFLQQVQRYFAEKSPAICEGARQLEYSEEFITESMNAAQIEKKCIEEIKVYIENSIVSSFSEFLRADALKTCSEDFDKLKEKVAEYEKDIEHTPAYQVLKQTMLEGYSLSSNAFMKGSISTFFIRFRKAIVLFFKSPSLIISRPVRDPEWKKLQAENYLNSIDHRKLVDCLVESLNDWFSSRHGEFTENLRASEQLVETGLRLSDAERNSMKSLYPKVAKLHMQVSDVLTSYALRDFEICTDNQLGSGAQGEVFAVVNKSGDPVMAAKRLVADDNSLNDIATEVYHTSILEHENLISVRGVSLHQAQKGKWRVDLFMDLMSGDVYERMQQERLSIERRVWVALQLANALAFLHQNELVHRDVKLANVLVSSDLNQVKLSDFGLVKGAAFAGHTLVGTPIYLAPELVRGETYSTASDVFSFAIALWYLAEGSGKHHPDYMSVVQSRSHKCRLSALDCRPKRPHNTPDKMWQLMEKCWVAAPERRPSIGQVVQELTELLNELRS